MPTSDASIAISPAGPEDIDLVQRLAHEIWHRHYPGIITTEQIDYMLERGYAREALLPLVVPDACRMTPGERGIALARIDGAAVGFVAWSPAGENASMKLEKLYVLPEHHGKGVGRALIEHVAGRARDAGCRSLTLNVNRGNTGSIRAYQRCGFSIAASGDFPIGGGYVMEDFIMQRDI
ncbi:MAG: N-acetyltransferase family protein [Candidatus Levyibacteriota bacterium]